MSIKGIALIKHKLISIAVIPLLIILCTPLAAQNKTIFKVGSDITVPANQTVEDIVAVRGNIELNGTARGDVVAIAGSVRLGPSSTAQGNVVSIGGNINKTEGATIGEDMVEVTIPAIKEISRNIEPGIFHGAFWIIQIASFIGFLALALLVTAIIPQKLQSVSEEIEKSPLKTFLWGLLVIILTIPVAILLAISIIGIPLIPLEFLIVAITFFIGYVAAAKYIGTRIILATNKNQKSILMETFLGVLILGAVGLIPVLGWLIQTLASIFGVGGIIQRLIISFQSKQQSQKHISRQT